MVWTTPSQAPERHSTQRSGELARMELRGIDALLASMDRRGTDMVYLADLIDDYLGPRYEGGYGWQLSRATAMRFKAMLESDSEK